MTDEHGKQSGGIGWGIPASVLLHVALAVVLFVHLPLDLSEPDKEQSISVELVPPPEEQKTEEQVLKPDVAKPEEEKQEAKKEEPAPPAPEPAKQEEAPPPAPSPPPEPSEEAKPPQPGPADPKENAQQEEAQTKPEDDDSTQPPPGNEKAREQAMPILNPVFQFGEKDAGPRESLTGNGAQDSATTSVDPETQPDPEAQKDVAEQPEPAEQPPIAEMEAPANPVPDDIAVPEIGVASADPQNNGPTAGASPDATRMELVAPPGKAPDDTAQKQPSKVPSAEKPAKLKEAKTLFSRSATRDPAATVAMAGMSRGARAGALCSSELGAQLRSMSYSADVVPRLPLPKGTVLDGKSVGFHAGGQWYDVTFRCQIDEGATKVVSFALDVGDVIPRSEWRKRGFPNF